MPSLRRSIVVSVLFTVFGGPGIMLVYLPLWITHFHVPAGETVWQKMSAAVLILVGLTPLLESIERFVLIGRGTLLPTVPTEHLVVSGLYRYVRNPMYVGVLISLAGEALLFWSRGVLLEGCAGLIAVHCFVLLYEEPTLTRKFPGEYPLYKRHVPRWLPRLTPWEASSADAG